MTDLAIAPPYLAPDDRARVVRSLASASKGDIAVIGTSVEGEPIEAIRLGSTGPGGATLLCTANIHGVEWIGGLVALGLVERLGSDDPVAAAVRRRADVWVVPCLNPDGYRRTWAQGGVGPLTELRANARGVDLNRNYPLPPGARRLALPGAGSDVLGDATYCGISPLSEPETRAVHELARVQGFHAAAGLHSFMGTLIPARVRNAAAYRTYAALCGAFARTQAHVRYRRLASRWIDAWTGEQEDHLHHGLDCWAVCVETFSLAASWRQHWRAPSKFWRFNPRTPAPWIEQDVTGLLAYFDAALDLPRPAAVSSGQMGP